MGRSFIIALVAASLSGCAAISPFTVSAKAPESVQLQQAATKDAFYRALGERLRYCSITGTVDLTLKVQADAGLSNTAGLNCPAKAWENVTTAAPLTTFTNEPPAYVRIDPDQLDAAVAKALDEYTKPPS